MSYARFSQGSDVYVYLNVGGYFSCGGCRLSPSRDSQQLWTTGEMLAHLARHVAAGQAVPEDCFERLRVEAVENDEWIACRHPGGMV